MKVECSVSRIQPLACVLRPDCPAYDACEVAIDYTDALLRDLGPTLLMLYASYAGPPVTREALQELAQPVVTIQIAGAAREELLQRVREEYPAVLQRARERVETLA